MFFRLKKSGPRHYLQIVENYWTANGPRQRVLKTLGRVDDLQARGAIDSLLQSGARFADKIMILSAEQRGELPSSKIRPIGAVRVFEKLWLQTGCRHAIEALVAGRKFGFNMERAVFLTVLHRLLQPGSDRAADKWKTGYDIDGCDQLALHHLYRAMAWLGEQLADNQQQGSTKLVPRCVKDLVEERIFASRRDLFTQVDIVFFDTTSIYFEGDGGESLGQYGHSMDHRPDEKQMIVGAVLDGEGRPICCELWPGNTADVTTLIPVVERLWRRFKIRHVCIVADRGLISKDTMADLDAQGWPYILGVRMRKTKEVRERVLTHRGRFQVVHGLRENSTAPAPLKVKEVWVDERRYVVCINAEEVESDCLRREAILESLRERLTKGDKSLAGNKGYKRYLKVEGDSHFAIDDAKIEEEAQYDGKWVLQTSTALATADVALQFKQLWRVEHWFRSSKSLLETRPLFHKQDATIRGHVFCSFLALVLRHELQTRVAAKGHNFEWADMIADLERLQINDVILQNKHFRLRSDLEGTCGRVFQAVGAAIPPVLEAVE